MAILPERIIDIDLDADRGVSIDQKKGCTVSECM